jgi:hypothetical protein
VPSSNCFSAAVGCSKTIIVGVCQCLTGNLCFGSNRILDRNVISEIYKVEYVTMLLSTRIHVIAHYISTIYNRHCCIGVGLVLLC